MRDVHAWEPQQAWTPPCATGLCFNPGPTTCMSTFPLLYIRLNHTRLTAGARALLTYRVRRTRLTGGACTCSADQTPRVRHSVIHTRPTCSSALSASHQTDRRRAHAAVYAIILLSTSITVSINIPEFVVFAALLLVMTAVMLRVYLPTATRIKKLRLDSAGSLVGLTAEVLEGLPLVQAYSKEEHFVRVRFPSRCPATSHACPSKECTWLCAWMRTWLIFDSELSARGWAFCSFCRRSSVSIAAAAAASTLHNWRMVQRWFHPGLQVGV